MLTKTRPFRPSSPYSASKAAADLLVQAYVRTYNFPATITRSSNNYGPFQFPEKFMPLMISNALEDKPLPIYGAGEEQRHWLHVEDHCRGLLMVLERGQAGQVYNLGGTDIIQNIAVARSLLRILGKPESLISYVQDRPGHDRRYALRGDKVEKDLGWKPQIALEDGLRQTIQWYQNNAEWLSKVRGGEYQSYYERYYGNRDSSLWEIARAKRQPS